MARRVGFQVATLIYSDSGFIGNATPDDNRSAYW